MIVRQSPVIKKWLVTFAFLFAVTDLDGTLTRGDTLFNAQPFPGVQASLKEYDKVLYLSCKVWVARPAQTWWLEANDFPEGESYAIGTITNWWNTGGGCLTHKPKCDFLKAYPVKFTHGFSEDEQSLEAYRCAGIPNVIKVVR